jgi:hypothetical protein
MQINESKIAFISFYLFFRIVTFQWVKAEKIKKSAVVLISRLGCGSDVSNRQPSSLSVLMPPDRRSSIRLMTIRITRSSWFGKINSGSYGRRTENLVSGKAAAAMMVQAPARPQNAGPTANAGLESRNSVSEFELRDPSLLHLAFGAPVKVRISATEWGLSGGCRHPESLAISEPTNLV